MERRYEALYLPEDSPSLREEVYPASGEGQTAEVVLPPLLWTAAEGPVKLTAIDGPPGTGKTTDIITQAPSWGKVAIVTYTNDAANTIKLRAPHLRAGTIYSLSWPYVKQYAKNAKRRVHRSGAYTKRRIDNLMDPALRQYENDAPSKKERHQEDVLAPLLHSWSEGPPPFDLNIQAQRELHYILPIARWLEAGGYVPEEDKFEVVVIDEAQDVSSLELRAAKALVRKGGDLLAYGDPGQAIFARGKGIEGKELPPAWVLADETHRLEGGFRVGDPVASAATKVLKSYYDRPAFTFMAGHETHIMDWEPDSRPTTGLVLGYSRYSVAKQFKLWGLRQVAVTPTVTRAQEELVLSTGHAAKGGEADDVYLLPWSHKAVGRFEVKDPDAIRLMYVMMTRAIKRLHIPRTLKARILR